VVQKALFTLLTITCDYHNSQDLGHTDERYIHLYSDQQSKSDLLEIIRRLENVEDAVAVTKNGVPAAVILSMDRYRGLLETLDILSDEKMMKSLRRSMRQARKGKWVKYDEVFGR
jgi:antitoxin YefM